MKWKRCIVSQLMKQKSKVWQENMGIKHVPGIKLSNHVICSRHFSPNAYANPEQ
ncbi:hypothetical protein NQ317_009458 [Molorchus minor]|uniref:THAP-type domain-containing protein n=1 Tax=Molorchus minor TaxID=1323400 RepID=A0ABQ9JML2_9CUCU|nr:hypothetical protein NQ317_009458 [Molorchus minor]